MGYLWNYTDKGNIEVTLKKKCIPLPMVRHKSNKEWLGIKPEYPRWQAGS
jgi:hypothetical protein